MCSSEAEGLASTLKALGSILSIANTEYIEAAM